MQQRQRKKNRNERSWDMEKIIRNLKIDLTGDPEEETSKNVCEARVEEVPAENSLGVMMNNMSYQIQRAQRVLSKMRKE